MPKLIDLTGNRFGRLLVLGRATEVSPETRRNEIRWHVRCDCTTEKTVCGIDLRLGDSQSCGCLQRDLALEKLKRFPPKRLPVPMVGRVFGRLTVLEREGSKHEAAAWRCRCVCEREVVVSGKVLRRGHSKSCGCYFAESRDALAKSTVKNIAGMQFGWLTVMRRDESEGGRKGAWWVCRCRCNNEKTLWGAHLRSGMVASCGCAFGAGAAVRPAEVRTRRAARVRARRRRDPRFALNSRMSCLVRSALTRRGGKKRGEWAALVGYTIDELELRLKATMPEGHSWADFLSGWLHIDHYRPLSSFRFTSANDPGFREAWALSNLRLLPGPDNVKKGRKMPAECQPPVAA